MSERALHPPVLDADGRPLDVIELHGLTVECIIGMYSAERLRPQPRELDVALFLDARAAARSGKVTDTVNYARLSGELRFILDSCRFELLESAAEALCRYILAPPTQDAPRARVQAVSLRLSKPRALGGQSMPSLQVHRRAEEMQYAQETKGFGEVDIIHEGTGYGIYRLRVRPGGTIPTHVHRVMEESELVLGAGLHLQGAPVRRGSAFRWPHGLPHRYDNPSDTEQTILCVDRPPFIPGDEVEVETPAAGLQPQPSTSYYVHEDTARPEGRS